MDSRGDSVKRIKNKTTRNIVNFNGPLVITVSTVALQASSTSSILVGVTKNKSTNLLVGAFIFCYLS